MQIQVAVLLSILLGMFDGAPLHPEESETSDSNYLQKNFIDGIEESKLPKKYRDTAMMCDVFKKLSALKSGADSESGSKHDTAHLTTITGVDSDSSEFTDTDPQQGTALAEHVKELLKELTLDAGTDSENVDDGEQAVRSERVKRNNGNGIPQELLQVLQGVCVTDECLQVVREYFEWRRQNGYPVYTGVSELGK